MRGHAPGRVLRDLRSAKSGAVAQGSLTRLWPLSGGLGRFDRGRSDGAGLGRGVEMRD